VPWSEAELAAVVISEIAPASVVNLGIGLPLLLGRHGDLPEDVLLHSENGVFGMGSPAAEGAEDEDLVNAGKEYVTLGQGASITDQVDSFALVRAGYIDLAVLGAYQVSSSGDLANWKQPDQKIAGVGGAVDIAMGAKQVWVMMRASAKDGTPKLVRTCEYPLTAAGVVSRVFTDVGVLEPSADRGGFLIRALAPEVTFELPHRLVSGVDEMTGSQNALSSGRAAPRPSSPTWPSGPGKAGDLL
jgi:3-oxoacid CoA-transferase B subunit